MTTITKPKMMDVAELGAMPKEQLLDMAHDYGLEDGAALAAVRREDLLNRMLHAVSAQQSLISSGILEIMDEGYGFLRQINYLPATGDVYISQSQIPGSACAPATRLPARCVRPRRASATSAWYGWSG